MENKYTSQCCVLMRSLGFFKITYGIFSLLHSPQVTLSITASNVCYIMSMKCSDYRSFLLCISNKKDVRNLSLEIFFTSYSLHLLAMKFLGGNPSVTTSGDAFASDVV